MINYSMKHFHKHIKRRAVFSNDCRIRSILVRRKLDIYVFKFRECIENKEPQPLARAFSQNSFNKCYV